jgi:metallophosphoesterase (TIGR00282 family)
MRILFVGDVVGKPGREAVMNRLPALRIQQQADFVIVNGENSAGGIGITREIGDNFLNRAGADVITLGNHAWGKRESYPYLSEEPRILRPHNYPPGAPGRGFGVFDSETGPVGVIVLQGRTFMDPVDDPFRAVDQLLTEIKRSTPVVFVELHGEATSEKQAMAWYVAGRASAVVGTHTHVQTADERILPGGTAYLTDAGMTGPYDSIIGMSREVIIPRFTSLLPNKFEVAGGPSMLNAVAIDIDTETGRATGIERIQILPKGQAQ